MPRSRFVVPWLVTLPVLGIGLAAVLPACSGGDHGPSTQSSDIATGTGAGGDSSGSGGGHGGEGGAGGNGPSPDPWYCADAVQAIPSGVGFSVQTPHYDLYAETDATSAEELGRLLEAAWSAFSVYFAASPALAADEKLRVAFYVDQAAFEAGLTADGLPVPAEAGGYFDSGTRRAYLFRQGNPYYDHVLLLHEATHQFHLLGRSGGKPLPFWYVEGLAESLGRHDWDGGCVRLGALPLLSWEDLPEQALVEAESGLLDVPDMLANGGNSRSAAWALVHYLDRGEAALKDAFTAFRSNVDGGADVASTFAMYLGDPATIDSGVEAYLPAAQEPMRPVYTEWLHREPGSAVGDSPGVFSFAILKEPPTHFQVTIDPADTPSGFVGVLLGYTTPNDYQALLVAPSGELATFTVSAAGAFIDTAGSVPGTNADGNVDMVIDYGENGMVTAVVNGSSQSFDTGLLPGAGLALYDARTRFRDAHWE